MPIETDYPNRRTFLKYAAIAAAIAAATCALDGYSDAKAESKASTSLFDGKTLDGWIQAQNSATAVGGGDISDFAALAKKLTQKSDAVSLRSSPRISE